MKMVQKLFIELKILQKNNNVSPQKKDSNWIEYLTLNVKGDFKQGERFIENNKDLICFG